MCFAISRSIPGWEDLYMTLLSNILSNAVGLNYIQTQDCKTFLETLYSPNVTLWGKKND